MEIEEIQESVDKITQLVVAHSMYSGCRRNTHNSCYIFVWTTNGTTHAETSILINSPLYFILSCGGF